MHWQTIAGICLAAALGCMAGTGWAQQTRPLGMEPYFQLNPTDPSDLAQQTRRYAQPDRAAILFASTAVLQDMGFKMTGGEKRVGLLVGEKTADVPGAGLTHAIGEAMLVTATTILSVAVGENLIMDLPEQVAQVVHVSLLVSADGNSEETVVRISLDRDMIYDHGHSIPDHTELPLIYQEFFERLNRAVFLEGESL